ncbi:divergent PAP2 family protein [Calidifontibacillus erzurumensis]|uniref:Divergent PAP2 family protein n=1 Tax=Calidifontibacillus erzurumensis TaxID=2741433 RepID=A0A8J8GG47_9BACI|nr:divergent PAP2 family protein [Calidifontibacillus erzurumensis]NSL51695.1 divergent PAP2 family protein [Calidifontibacillus erzurumensis]
MEIFYNFPLWASIISIFFAQFIKVPISLIATKKIDWSLLTSTGGMPSSHSGAVTALATAIALEEGLQSPLFAISVVFGLIVMFDATGIRYHAGEQATVLNWLVAEFQQFISEAKSLPKKEQFERRKELKELLGHKPIEVFFGALTGIVLTLLLYYFVY